MKLLDCTLRDGGYNNQWAFGANNIDYIIENLVLSNVDIIELGYFDYTVKFDEDRTIYNSILQLNRYINKFPETEFALMVDHKKNLFKELDHSFPRDMLLRYAFHKEDINDALEQITRLVAAGFRVYVQPMVTNNYSSQELSELIQRINVIKPLSLYIVDSFGSLTTLELLVIIDTFKQSLDRSIIVGFHAHENRGLSMANGTLFMHELSTSQYDYVLDSSINGMGRGAGNLKTEFILDELIIRGKTYHLEPIFNVIDNYFDVHHPKRAWGYSLTKQLSGRINAHPNYAIFLEDIGLLTYSQVDLLLKKIEVSKRIRYDESYIANLYKNEVTNNYREIELPDFNGKKVVIIAPGNESVKFDYNSFILKNIGDVAFLAVNHQPEHFLVDFVIITKIKRYSSSILRSGSKLIVTDDIDLNDNKVANKKYIVGRNKIMNDYSAVEDNAGLMSISLAIISGASSIGLIGFDGYTKSSRNVIESILDVSISSNRIDKINDGMRKALLNFSKIVAIDFITNSLYNQ